MGDRFSLWVRSGFLACLGRRIVWRCVPFLFALVYNVVGSSISVLLLAPDAWARGCWLLVTLPSVSCPVSRSHSCCRSVSLCEELAVILVLRGGSCACALSCGAPASGLWFLGASLPSTGSVVAVLVLGCPVLLAWTVPCFSLGAWSLIPASSSVACHPSPSLGLARLVGLCLSPLVEMVSLLFHGNIVAHFWGISRSVFAGV